MSEIGDGTTEFTRLKADNEHLRRYLLKVYEAAGLSPESPKPLDQHIESLRNQFVSARLDTIEECAKIAENRDVLGYVPDVGCFNCFNRVARAIRGLNSADEEGK